MARDDVQVRPRTAESSFVRPVRDAPLGKTSAPERPTTSSDTIGAAPASQLRAVPVLLTLITLVLAGLFSWAMWRAYMAAPWTRDGTVRAYVVTIAPEISGRVVELPVADNQFVRKGDRLVSIDPTDYAIAVARAQAVSDQAGATAENAEREAVRRAKLTTLEVSNEEIQTYRSSAIAARAAYRLAVADLARARADLERTTIRSPVNGYVTNLRVQTGDYATVGQIIISLVNTDSYWVDGYFEETQLSQIHPGDRANIKLIGSSAPILGHVAGIARGITVANAAPGQSGLAEVNPIFTWVRLAQRVPVRVDLDHVPDNVRLVAGQTASVEIVPRPGSDQTR
jgi:RND family efflux transporter MFP subunit